jgi:homoserine dehydrogenase
MSKPLNIAIAGLGTVGGGALQILTDNADILQERCGRKINLVAVSARDKNKNRGVDLYGVKWVDNPLEFAEMSEIDVVVELIGGSEGIAKELVEKSIKAGKNIVTANKALIAHHGREIAELAEKHNVMFAYEAAVAGGIPIIKLLREGLVANEFSKIAGILNGTCNFILTSMLKDKKDFATVLKEAQDIGYAEADPAFDIEGIDTAHKTAILTSLAFGCAPDIKSIYIEGITQISILDMQFADQLGFVIKLLGIATINEEGVLQRVHPCMIAKDSTIGRVDAAYNGIVVEGNAVGKITLEGRGAGAGATASSVVGDIVDIARGAIYKPFTIATEHLKNIAKADIKSLKSEYYLRLCVKDKSGVLAAITEILSDENISVNSLLQNPFIATNRNKEEVYIIITTHETMEYSIQKAINAIKKLEFITQAPHLIRIEKL